MCRTLFLYKHFFAVVFHNYQVKLPETSYNVVTRFMEEMSYVFSFTFFSMALIFTLHWWPLAFLVLSPPLQKFHVVLPTTLTLELCRSFSRWASLACRLHSLFPCLSLALYSKFLDMTIDLSLILYTCRFRLYLLFSCLCITRRGWLCDFPPK